MKVFHVKSEKQGKVFKEIEKSKSTISWFYTFKLRLVIDDKEEIMVCKLTSAKEDNCQGVVDILIKGFTGKLVFDKGYIKKL